MDLGMETVPREFPAYLIDSEEGRTCRGCGKWKPKSKYHKRKKYLFGLASWCKECTLEKNQAYYRSNTDKCAVAATKWRNENRERVNRVARETRAKNHEQYSAYQQAHRARRTLWFQSVKDPLSCVVCGESANFCLDFHHRDSSEKLFGVGPHVSWGTQESILAEIEKCVVLCANCHRKVHAGVISLELGAV